jgi:hypothetical protein
LNAALTVGSGLPLAAALWTFHVPVFTLVSVNVTAVCVNWVFTTVATEAME